MLGEGTRLGRTEPKKDERKTLTGMIRRTPRAVRIQSLWYITFPIPDF
jgi:hypothetical protein